ncbi:four helix bundle protein [Ekhidna sp.]|uniref:four helix bundle protein n=1 Tax=Ekhidna sp. TaxID=2608089 RepID=UPI003B511EFE
MAFKFENLRVWQKALELTGDIDDLTKKFPPDERFILTAQIKRAADSICLNIAEGSTGQSNKEFAKFLGYAQRSGIEVVSCLYVGRRRKIISDEDFNRFYKETEEIIVMIQALKKGLI